MATKNSSRAMTPRKDPQHESRSKNQESSKLVENFNPNNSSYQSPGSKPLFNSSSSSKSQKPSASKNPNNHPVAHSSRNKFRQRKFVVAKKKPVKYSEDEGAAGLTVSFCRCKENKGEGKDEKKNKCVCVAYENLRKSQEEFFKNRGDGEEEEEEGGGDGIAENESVLQEEEKEGCSSLNELGNSNTKVDLAVKRRRERLMEDERESVPQSGSGKVMNLVKAFEKLLTLPSQKEEKEPEENNKMVMPLLGFQFSREPETEVSCSSFSAPELVLTSENLGLDPGASLSSSWDSSRRSVSSRRTSTGSRRSRRNSLESSSTFGGRRWKKKQMRVTSQKPFQLRTEQRGKLKEEEFVKKIKEMMTEEEKQRIPIAQGLPLTTDEPECLLKPPVKESTRPVDLMLHSDVRAMDRAEFDHQVAEKLSFIEQYKLERERQKKLEEEEEVRRLRKDLVPKAQPMPYFDRPFLPRRSVKNPTIPREPKLRIPHHKKIKCSLSSWKDNEPPLLQP